MSTHPPPQCQAYPARARYHGYAPLLLAGGISYLRGSTNLNSIAPSTRHQGGYGGIQIGFRLCRHALKFRGDILCQLNGVGCTYWCILPVGTWNKVGQMSTYTSQKKDTKKLKMMPYSPSLQSSSTLCTTRWRLNYPNFFMVSEKWYPSKSHLKKWETPKVPHYNTTYGPVASKHGNRRSLLNAGSLALGRTTVRQRHGVGMGGERERR